VNGPEHYREAEGALNIAADLAVDDPAGERMERYWLAKALVHATLAAAAASCVGTFCGPEDVGAWEQVLGVDPVEPIGGGR